MFPILTAAAALPRTRLSNATLAAELAVRGIETTPEWIETRTGITQRYICGANESTFTLARDAALKALKQAGISPSQLGVIVVATCTPSLTFPSTAALVQGDIGAPATCAALDVNGACSGFIMALATAKGLLMQGMGEYALIIGADTFSRMVDWNDRTTCVLFGDGAGAVIMKKDNNADNRGLLGVTLGTDGTQAYILKSSGGPATTQTAGVTVMNGKEVYKHAVRQMGELPSLLADLGLTLNDIDYLIPHQANRRILEAAANHLGLPPEKLVITVDQHANTSAASIPLAMAQALADGRITPGKTLLLQAFGAGLAWGTAVVKW